MNFGGERWWEMGRCEWAATVFRVGFFGVFGGGSGGVPIWSGCLAVFGFVQGCSGAVRRGRGLSVAAWGVWWGERHGMALLFWGKSGRSWGERGCVVGDSWGLAA